MISETSDYVSDLTDCARPSSLTLYFCCKLIDCRVRRLFLVVPPDGPATCPILPCASLYLFQRGRHSILGSPNLPLRHVEATLLKLHSGLYGVRVRAGPYSCRALPLAESALTRKGSPSALDTHRLWTRARPLTALALRGARALCRTSDVQLNTGPAHDASDTLHVGCTAGEEHRLFFYRASLKAALRQALAVALLGARM